MKTRWLVPRFVLSKNQLAKSLLYADKGDKTMIYKVYYQETKVRNPKREETKSLYIEAKAM